MNVTVIGAQWGDEGKGKIVDLYSARADFIVRYQGGNNAGHTLVVEGKKTVLHLIPSGILHPGKTCLIANGVVFDPEVFFKEVATLQAAGVLGSEPWKQIKVSERAHVILDIHRTLDRLREEKASQSKGKIGTTVRGIGPAYEDKAARRGVQVVDLLHPNLLKEKLERTLSEKNALFKNHFGSEEVAYEPVFEKCIMLGEKLRPYIANVRRMLVDAKKAHKPILFEGAQGTLLDVDHGTYPYVTSSNTTAGGVITGCGVGSTFLQSVIGITKAYTTRVGVGPFPSEIEETEKETAEKIRKIGAEFGATTGRMRRVGWLDLVALKYAAEINGFTGLALMKSDVLNGFENIRVCTGYELHGRVLDELPSCIEDMEQLIPVYKTMKCWKNFDTKAVRSRGDLPKELQDFMTVIEKFVDLPIVLLSTGPGREETLQLLDPFQNG